MSTDLRTALFQAVTRILRPLVRILLRNGVPFNAFAELAKQVYVEVAMNEFQLPGRKPSVSRTAVVTGLTRKDVSRLHDAELPEDRAGLERYNRAARVVAGWVRDADFQDGESPARLPLDGEGATFAGLVRRYSGDMPARAVLDELQNVGTVRVDEDGRVHLLARSYVPAGDDVSKLDILGTDVAYLVETINHNLTGNAPYFQRKVAYDNLPDEFVESFRGDAARQCQALIENLDRQMSTNDRDANPKVAGQGRRFAGVGIYYFERNLENPEGGER